MGEHLHAAGEVMSSTCPKCAEVTRDVQAGEVVRAVPEMCPCGHGVPRYAADGGWGTPLGTRPVPQEFVPGPDGEPVTRYPSVHGRAYVSLGDR